MQNNILFDNIYIGHSIDDARKLADETFFKKHPIEELLELADKPKEEEKPKSPSDLKFADDPVTYIKEKLDLFLTIAQKDPIEAIKFVPEIAGGLAAVVVTIIALIAGVVSLGGSAAPAAKKVATDVKEKSQDAKDKVAEATASGAEKAKAEANKRATRSSS
jgi:calnexin